MTSYFFYHISHVLIFTHISDLQFYLPSIMTSKKVKIRSETPFWPQMSWPPDINDLLRSKYEINENNSCEVLNQLVFLVFQFLFDPRWSRRSWPPDINDLRMSKYVINENQSCEVSNLVHVVNSYMLITLNQQEIQASERSFTKDLLFHLNG